MGAYAHLIPEGMIALAAVIVLFAELVPGLRRAPAGCGAAVAAVAAAVALWAGPAGPLFGGMLLVDETATFVRISVCALSAVFLLWVEGRGFAGERPREAVSLVLFAAVGGMLMASANDLVTLFISIELATMPAYVLMGYARTNERSLEGALKYYLLSLLTSLVMLYGLALFYGVTGTTAYDAIDLSGSGIVGVLAALFVTVGFLAKLSAAPFHYWAPDAYAGAPAPAVAFVSSVPKVAGLAALVRLIVPLVGQATTLSYVLIAASVASMLLGNLAAYPQTDIRRLMAYSGIAHVGYVLLAVSAGTAIGASAAVFYSVAYAMPSMAIMLIAAEEGSRLEDLAGLSRRRPWIAWVAVGLLLSLVGIPPLVGFFGKLYLFGAALDAGLVSLVVVGVLMSAVSLGYYFRIVRAMFASSSAEHAAGRPALSVAGVGAIVLLFAGTLLIGIGSAPLLTMLGYSIP
jgi:NADH-quinone oxidoreductase subunit N